MFTYDVSRARIPAGNVEQGAVRARVGMEHSAPSLRAWAAFAPLSSLVTTSTCAARSRNSTSGSSATARSAATSSVLP